VGLLTNKLMEALLVAGGLAVEITRYESLAIAVVCPDQVIRHQLLQYRVITGGLATRLAVQITPEVAAALGR